MAALLLTRASTHPLLLTARDSFLIPRSYLLLPPLEDTFFYKVVRSTLGFIACVQGLISICVYLHQVV